MFALLNTRLWLLVGIAGILAFSHFAAFRKGKSDVRMEWQAAVAAADSEARRLERARQSRVDEAAKLAAARETRILADAARTRSERDGLRGDLNAAVEYAAQSRAAAEQTARVATGLLETCSRLLVDVSEAADRADSESRELRQAWPR